jgi:hypothetical protein
MRVPCRHLAFKLLEVATNVRHPSKVVGRYDVLGANVFSLACVDAVDRHVRVNLPQRLHNKLATLVHLNYYRANKVLGTRDGNDRSFRYRMLS